MDAATLPDTDELLPPVAHTIWDMKYRFKERDGTPIDRTMDDTRKRVAGFLAGNDTEKQMFMDAMRGWKFLPAGRILAGAGTDRRVTNINCFVLGQIDDSLNGIMDALKDAATTMQAGGGIGHDFSTLRPKGAPVHRVGADASGPLSFMNMWDSMCKTIMSAGSRRGAMMGTMRVDHPDIEAFIEAKRDAERLRMFNLSVLVTDDFMDAVKHDGSHDLVFTRRVLQPDNSHTEERVESASMALWRRLHGDEPPPDYFVDAGTISPEDHVRMQAAAQAHIDSAVSKTVNVPKDISFEAFKDIYLLAWESGCKGCTTYRPNDITGAILVADGDNLAEPAPTVMDRPSVLLGQTRKVPWPGSEHAFYLTLNHTVDRDGNNRPFEIFIATKDARHHAWVTAVTRMISAVWRRQGDVGFVAEELMAIADPNDGQWVKGRGWVASLIALIGMEIRDWMVELGHIDPDEPLPPINAGPAPIAERPAGPVCPKCSQPGMIHQEGCDHCPSCGHSRCS